MIRFEGKFCVQDAEKLLERASREGVIGRFGFLVSTEGDGKAVWFEGMYGDVGVPFRELRRAVLALFQEPPRAS